MASGRRLAAVAVLVFWAWGGLVALGQEEVMTGEGEKVAMERSAVEVLSDSGAGLAERLGALGEISDQGLAAEEQAVVQAVIGSEDAPLLLRREALEVLRDADLPVAEQWEVLGPVLEAGEGGGLAGDILNLLARDGALRNEAVQVLRGLATDSDALEWLRRRSVDLLMQADGGVGWLEQVGRVLREESLPMDLRMEVMARARAMVEGEGFDRVLMELAKERETAPAVRTAALRLWISAGRLGPDGRRALMELVEDPEQLTEVRAAAVQGLQELALDQVEKRRLLRVLVGLENAAELKLALARLLQGAAVAREEDRQLLIHLLLDRGEEAAVRLVAAEQLQRVGVPVEKRVPVWSEVLTAGGEDPRLRVAAARALEGMGRAALPAADALIRTAANEKAAMEVRAAAAQALGQLAQVHVERPDQLRREDLNARLAWLERVSRAMAGLSKDQEVERGREQVARVSGVLRAEKESRYLERTVDWWEAHSLLERWWTWIGLVVLVWLAGWVVAGLGLALAAPAAAGRLADKLPGGRVGQWMTVAIWWGFNGRVLEREMKELARAGLVGGDSEGPFVATPVRVRGRTREEMDGLEWRRLGDESGGRLWLSGLPGTGKTRWLEFLRKEFAGGQWSEGPILPVPLSAGRLGRPEAAVKELGGDRAGKGRSRWEVRVLRRGGIVFLIDDVNADSQADFDRFVEALKPYPGAWVVAASRRLDCPGFLTVQVECLVGGQPAGFVMKYLQRSAGSRLGESERLDKGKHLTAIANHQPSPAELACLFAEHACLEQEGRVLGWRPESLADVVRQWVVVRNWGRRQDRAEDDAVLEQAGQLAEQCLKEGFVSGWIAWKKSEGEEDWRSYLVDIGVAERRDGSVRFKAGAGAVYLAAWRRMEQLQAMEEWQGVMRRWEESGEDGRELFLWALLNCAGSRFQDEREGKEARQWLVREIQKRLGLSDGDGGEEVAHQVQQLTDRLLVPEVEDRETLLRELLAHGAAVQLAMPRLLEVFRDRQEDLEVRQSALEVLAGMEDLSEGALLSLVEVVKDRSEHSFFRVRILQVLGKVGKERPEVVQSLGGALAVEDEAPFFRMKARETLAGL